jgi:poly(3-hydroxybutyrate) depolymerase
LLVGIAGKNAPCINTLNALFTSAAAAEYILVAPCLTATSYDDIAGTADTHSEPAMSEIVHQLRNVITSVKRSLCVDARRIFFAGFGSGGALAEMAASRLPDLIRAIASVGGVFDGATRSHQSLIHFHGTCDDAVPFLGSPDRPSVVEHMLRWAVRASCEQPPTSTFASDNHQNLVWSCPNSVQVELIISLGARHGWIKEDSFDTTDQIVGFFSGHSHDWNSNES